MRRNIKHIIKDILLKEDFDPGAAFDHIEKMTGRRPPFSWLILNRPDDIREEDLNVDGDVDLQFSSIRELPENLTINGSLSISNCKLLESLPKGLYVTDFIKARECTSLKTIADGTRTNGMMDLEGCNSLEDIPNNLYIGGALYIDPTCPIYQKFKSPLKMEEYIESKGGYLGLGIRTLVDHRKPR